MTKLHRTKPVNNSKILLVHFTSNCYGLVHRYLDIFLRYLLFGIISLAICFCPSAFHSGFSNQNYIIFIIDSNILYLSCLLFINFEWLIQFLVLTFLMLFGLNKLHFYIFNHMLYCNNIDFLIWSFILH